MSYVMAHKNNINKNYMMKSEALRLAQQALNTFPSETNTQTRRKAKRLFDLWSTQFEQTRSHYCILLSGKERHTSPLEMRQRARTVPSSYRPIPLLNLDEKYCLKYWPCILPVPIHPCEAGFVKGRAVVSNILDVTAVQKYSRIHPNEDSQCPFS